MQTCTECGSPLQVGADPRRRTCSKACRQRGTRRRRAEESAQRVAVLSTLVTRGTVDPDLIAAARRALAPAA